MITENIVKITRIKRAEPLPDTPYTRAAQRLLVLGLQTSIMGGAPDWDRARAQLTDAERAALAKPAESPEYPALGSGDHG